MELLPNDVRQHRFGKGVRGYATDEVDQFLEHVAKVLEDALEARQRADETVRRLEHDMERFREQEGALKKAVFAVEQAMETARASGMKEVESTRREAEMRARQIIHEAEMESRKLDGDLKYLRDAKQGLVEQIRAFCRAQLAMLEGHDLPDRVREASRAAVQPRPVEPPRTRAASPAGSTPSAPQVAQPTSVTPAAPGALESGRGEDAKSPRRWEPARVERDEVDAKISEALGVDDAPVFPPPLVPEGRGQGDR